VPPGSSPSAIAASARIGRANRRAC
jgi:hypothetical protein